jgi:hypothetical protein
VVREKRERGERERGREDETVQRREEGGGWNA